MTRQQIAREYAQRIREFLATEGDDPNLLAVLAYLDAVIGGAS